mgnify:CR=1 FL=1
MFNYYRDYWTLNKEYKKILRERNKDKFTREEKIILRKMARKLSDCLRLDKINIKERIYRQIGDILHWITKT